MEIIPPEERYADNWAEFVAKLLAMIEDDNLVVFDEDSGTIKSVVSFKIICHKSPVCFDALAMIEDDNDEDSGTVKSVVSFKIKC